MSIDDDNPFLTGGPIPDDLTLLVRLRAEYLLLQIDNKEQRPVTISNEDRETLHRIASAPSLDDREFLGGFDFICEQDIDEEER